MLSIDFALCFVWRSCRREVKVDSSDQPHFGRGVSLPSPPCVPPRVSREFLKKEMEAVRAERKACQEQLSQHTETSRALQVCDRKEGGRRDREGPSGASVFASDIERNMGVLSC